MTPYHRAQLAITELKVAALEVLGGDVEGTGATVGEVGRLLGINVSRLDDPMVITVAVLETLKHEGLARTDEDGRWHPV